MKIRLSLLLFATILFSMVACENKSPKKTTTTPQGESTAYLEKGKEIAGATFTALSGKLQAAMKEGGVSKAIEYCNLAAFPLVDSLSKVHHADIRRTSLKVRNPKDAPTAEEKTILETYEKSARAGGTLKPIVSEVDEQTVAFYAPIKVNSLCLQCHGIEGETLTEDNLALIRQFYPDDKAIGYTDGDLRGMWSIRFEKKGKE